MFFQNLAAKVAPLFAAAEPPITHNEPVSTRVVIRPGTSAGVHVDPDTALKLGAVYRCVSLISDSLADLPWHITQPRADGGSDRIVAGTTAWLLHRQANPEMSAPQWRRTMTAWKLLWGNGYSEVERDRAGRPSALWPIEPDRVRPVRTQAGALVYDVRHRGRSNVVVPMADMFHARGLGWNGLVGYSVVAYAAEAIGLGLAAQNYGSSFFGNSAIPAGVIEAKEGMGMELEDSKTMLDTWNEKMRGSSQSNRVMYMDEGHTFKPITIPMQDAQFLETRNFSVIDIGRWFGVPPHKLSALDRATHSNIEHQNMEFATDAILPVARIFECEADIKVLGTRTASGRLSKLKLTGLLRGDTKTRSAFYKDLFSMGVLSPNQIMLLEDLNPVGPEGDHHFVMMNLQTLENASKPPPDPPPPADPEPDDDDLEDGDEDESEDDTPEGLARHTILADAFKRGHAREDHRLADAMKRFSSPATGGFSDWADDFSMEHKVWQAQALEAPIRAAWPQVFASPAATARLIDGLTARYLEYAVATQKDRLFRRFAEGGSAKIDTPAVRGAATARHFLAFIHRELTAISGS